MPIINKGTSFSNGEQLSASKLNALIDDATFGTESVDNSSTLVNASGAITVRDSGITAAKLATGAVTTAKILDANVTFAKLDDVIDDDTMGTATNTTLATSESIKAYVDSQGAEYAMKYSTANGTISISNTWTNWDLSGTIGTQRCLVILELYNASTTYNLNFRTPGSTRTSYDASSNAGWGASGGIVSNLSRGSSFVVVTDASGIIEAEASTAATSVPYRILAYQKLA
jgi:hypothetical protein